MDTRELRMAGVAETADEWFDEVPEPILTDTDSFERWVAFSGLKLRVASPQFRGGSLTAMFAGVTVDLRESVLSPEGATLRVDSTLSGIDILVPGDWEVVDELEGICSGVGGRRFAQGQLRGGPNLRVVGTVVAGGLSVR